MAQEKKDNPHAGHRMRLRQEYAAQMQQASEASKAAHQKQQADLQTALSSGDPDAFAAALAAFANGRQA